MSRPSNLIYGASDQPPAVVCLLAAAQLPTVVAPIMIYPILVMRETGATDQAVAEMISLSFLALRVATPLQALTLRWVGSGYLILAAPAAPYVPVGIAAIKLGGMPLLMGMTLLAGLFEVAFAQIVRRARAYFPAEVSGLCILLIGVIIGVLGLRAVFGLDQGAVQSTATARDLGLSAATLGLMIGLTLWGRGPLRMYCAAIGVAAGYVLAVLIGTTNGGTISILASAPFLAWPNWPHRLPAFSADLVLPFMVAVLICALRAMGDITAAQKINDREWIRPDMTSIRNGIMANGVGTLIAALAGGIGGNTQSSSIGMANATGVASRRVAWWLGALLIALSVVPVASAVLVATPRAIMGASLLFTSCFVIVSGLQIITSRLLDPRRTFVIGLALILSPSHDLFPGVYAGLPAALQPFLGSNLAIGLISALALNALFRIGVRTQAAIAITPSADAHDAIRTFLEQQGARWGARRDVIERAVFGTAQAVESIAEHCDVRGVVAIAASFDEFNLDIRLSYQGEDLALPESRPSDDEIRDSEDGVRMLAGYLIQRNADRVRAARKADRAVLEFHFQH